MESGSMVEEARPFLPGDFLVFEAHKQRDPLFNEARRRVRAKLGALGKFAARELAKRGDARFETRTSLNHPYSYNAYRVDAMWFTLYRPKSERGPLQEILGGEFREDLDPSYQHVLLFGELHLGGFRMGLRIHEKSWWDTQNLVRCCKQSPDRERLSDALRPLAGFLLRIHDHQKHYRCEEMTPGMLGTFAQYFKPGEHRFTLWREWGAQAPELLGPEAPRFVVETLATLLPAYRAIAWRPDHDLVFGRGAGTGRT
jgi:hypothetical protein